MNAAMYSFQARDAEEQKVRDEAVEEIAAFLEERSLAPAAKAIRERFLSTSTERDRYPDAT